MHNDQAEAAMPDPVTVSVTRADSSTGELEHRTGRYEKRLADLSGVFADPDAFAARHAADPHELIYAVEEFRPSEDPGDLIHGTSTLLPGRIGDEFHITRGHLHAISDRSEIYHCLSGHGLMLMEALDGTTTVAELRPGATAHVGPHLIHRSVNVGSEPLVTLFCYPADAGQDYDIIRRSGGMAHLVVADGDSWSLVPNPAHIPRG